MPEENKTLADSLAIRGLSAEDVREPRVVTEKMREAIHQNAVRCREAGFVFAPVEQPTTITNLTPASIYLNDELEVERTTEQSVYEIEGALNWNYEVPLYAQQFYINGESLSDALPIDLDGKRVKITVTVLEGE